MAAQQREAVDNVLSELDVGHIPYLCVWNKVLRYPLVVIIFCLYHASYVYQKLFSCLFG